jgi:hypothetical protein
MTNNNSLRANPPARSPGQVKIMKEFVSMNCYNEIRDTFLHGNTSWKTGINLLFQSIYPVYSRHGVMKAGNYVCGTPDFQNQH